MTTFCLVHGAWHGGWCWERLAPELEARGGRVVAPDLPCEDVEAGVSVYADVGRRGARRCRRRRPGRALARRARDPARRGAATRAQARLPLRARPDVRASRARGRWSKRLVPGFPSAIVRDELGRSYWVDPAAAVRDLFHDAPPEPALEAAARLRRQARAPSREPCPLAELPDVERVSIVCREDRAVSPDWSRAGRAGAARRRAGRAAGLALAVPRRGRPSSRSCSARSSSAARWIGLRPPERVIGGRHGRCR